MAKIPYNKPSLSPQEQVNLLEKRGIKVLDRHEAEHFLRYHNYYQISGYVFYFEEKGETRTHRLSKSIYFSDLISLVRFDKNLRETFFSFTSDIEIAFRSSMAYRLTKAYGPFCFQNEAIFRNPSLLPLFRQKLDKALENHKNEPFVAHHTRTYQEFLPPAWVMIELLTLGNISWLYSQLRSDLQKNIAADFFVDHTILVSWLKALTELRNTCAHHMRLWNKVFVNYPKLRNADKHFPVITGMESRLASFLPMLFHFINILHKNPTVSTELIQTLSSQSLIKPEDMGLEHWPPARGRHG